MNSRLYCFCCLRFFRVRFVCVFSFLRLLFVVYVVLLVYVGVCFTIRFKVGC